MQNARVSSASKIAWYLDKTNQGDLTWWNAVKEGTQDPFEKMVWADGCKGAGQLNAVNSEQLPDDTIISL